MFIIAWFGGNVMMGVLMTCLRGWISGVLLAAMVAGASWGQRAVSASFDHFVLSLSWSPEYCALAGDTGASSRECVFGRRIGFVADGLWPRTSAGGGPEACGGAKSVAKGLINSLPGTMPGADRIQRDWVAHGTCTGMTTNEYFTSLLLARAAVLIPVQFSTIAETTQESPAQIEAQFAGANPEVPEKAFRTVCRGGALMEVRVCFGKDLKAQACPVGEEECSAATVSVRQLR